MLHDSEVSPRSPKASRFSAGVVFALIIGLFAGVLCFGAMGWLMLSRSSGRALLSHVWSAATGRTLSIDVSQPTVVDRIQRLQRLETVVYTMDKLVTGAKENPVLPDFLEGDRLLMMVHGEVVAGIDFSNLKPGDVRVEGKQVQLHLPAAEVFSARIDSAKTRVYSRKLDCWSRLTRIWKRKCASRRNVSCESPPWPTAFCEPPNRMRLRLSAVCCRVWGSKRSTSSS